MKENDGRQNTAGMFSQGSDIKQQKSCGNRNVWLIEALKASSLWIYSVRSCENFSRHQLHMWIRLLDNAPPPSSKCAFIVFLPCFFVKHQLVPLFNLFLHIFLHILASIKAPLFLHCPLEREHSLLFFVSLHFFSFSSLAEIFEKVQTLSRARNGQDYHERSKLCPVICSGYKYPLCKWAAITFQHRSSWVESHIVASILKIALLVARLKI